MVHSIVSKLTSDFQERLLVRAETNMYNVTHIHNI